MKEITSFSGKYAFLSNFYPAKIKRWGLEFSTSEHLFVAMKTIDDDIRKHIATIETPGQVKRYGRTLELRKDWNKIKLNMMHICLTEKFKQNPHLIDLLLNTEQAELIEGNNWGDTYWGVCNGVGENNLGKTLMYLRWYYYVTGVPKEIDNVKLDRL